MIISASTDVGKKRDINQDFYNSALLNSDTAAWAVVCDGMGGMAAGNIASEQAVTVISKTLDNNLNPNASSKTILNLLKASVESANATVYDMAKENPEFSGMGTTVVVAVVKNNTVLLAHAGDSRAYLFSDGTLSQITTDHSIVQSMVDIGQLTEDEAKNHPNKNIITRAVGVNQSIDVDVCEISIKKDDIILLCTDGLTNCVDNQSITSVLAESDFNNLTKKLIDLANLNGGSDNITAVAILNN